MIKKPKLSRITLGVDVICLQACLAYQDGFGEATTNASNPDAPRICGTALLLDALSHCDTSKLGIEGLAISEGRAKN